MPRKPKSGIPRGYVFSPRGVLMNKKSLTRYERLVKKIMKATKRDKEDIYFSSDYSTERMLDILDETMVAIHTMVTQKDYLNAWYALYAFSEVMMMSTGLSLYDDGERITAMLCAFGSLLIETLRGLDSFTPSFLNENKLPELERALKRMGEWANEWHDTYDFEYHKVLNGYGAKLYGGVTLDERDRKREALRTAYEQFYNNMKEEDRNKKGYLPPRPGVDPDAELNEEDEDEDKGEDSDIWYGKADPSDTNYNHPSLQLSSTWKAYKVHIRTKEDKKRSNQRIWVTVRRGEEFYLDDFDD